MYIRAKYQNRDMDEHRLGSESYQKLHQLNRCFSSNPWGLQHDISNHVPHHFNIKTKTPYRYRDDSRSFSEVCLATAEKISSKTDKQIALTWSGGIDSTSALVALMQVLPLNRITVVCTKESIQEFPIFYEECIKDRVSELTPPEWSMRYQDYFTVSGDGGDTVWGVIDDSTYTRYHSVFDKPWQDHVDTSIKLDFDFIEEFCSWSGIEIKSWLELRIWFYLCCKWQDKCMRVFCHNKNLTDKDAAAFYDVDDSFQIWTINNTDKIIGQSWAQYKIPAKEFIFSYCPDKDYLENKSKVNSTHLTPALATPMTWQQSMRFVIPENFSAVSLAKWPLIDYADFEDFNDEYQLIPHHFLTANP
jgi:hypothetical protein